MNVEVVAVGTELLLGQIVDTNSAWIGEQLALAGLDSHFQTRVGDNAARIRRTLELALSRADAVIVCGGLGPTQDDITREVIAEVMGAPLIMREAIAERIRAMFAARGRPMPENNLRQAMVPDGATVIRQQPGTAPGLICPVGGRVIYAVPGVPYEMRDMVLGTVVPDLRRRAAERGEAAVLRSRVLRTWGTSESALAEVLADRITALDRIGNPTLAFLASGVEGLKVRITAKGPDDATVDALLAEEEEIVWELVGDWVFGVDDENMESVVIGLLREQDLTLAVAESITGGYVAGRICAVPGASDVFRGGVVSYASDVKSSLLEVPVGPVISEDAAMAMADGVRELLGADIGLATTGVAGPDPAEGLPVGTVCLAISMGSGGETATLRLPGDRERIRQFSAISILDLLRRRLLGL